MQVILKAFPAFYFFTTCSKHQCKVEVHVEESKGFQSSSVIGGQVMTLRCLEGGSAGADGCEDSWEVAISGGGDIRITH